MKPAIGFQIHLLEFTLFFFISYDILALCADIQSRGNKKYPLLALEIEKNKKEIFVESGNWTRAFWVEGESPNHSAMVIEFFREFKTYI